MNQIGLNHEILLNEFSGESGVCANSANATRGKDDHFGFVKTQKTFNARILRQIPVPGVLRSSAEYQGFLKDAA